MSAHPEVPVRRLTKVCSISLTTGEVTDITDSVTELVVTEIVDGLPVIQAQYVKDSS